MAWRSRTELGTRRRNQFLAEGTSLAKSRWQKGTQHTFRAGVTGMQTARRPMKCIEARVYRDVKAVIRSCD